MQQDECREGACLVSAVTCVRWVICCSGRVSLLFAAAAHQNWSRTSPRCLSNPVSFIFFRILFLFSQTCSTSHELTFRFSIIDSPVPSCSNSHLLSIFINFWCSRYFTEPCRQTLKLSFSMWVWSKFYKIYLKFNFLKGRLKVI